MAVLGLHNPDVHVYVSRLHKTSVTSYSRADIVRPFTCGPHLTRSSTSSVPWVYLKQMSRFFYFTLLQQTGWILCWESCESVDLLDEWGQNVICSCRICEIHAAVLEKLTVGDLVKILAAFCGILNFIIMSPEPTTGRCPVLDESSSLPVSSTFISIVSSYQHPCLRNSLDYSSNIWWRVQNMKLIIKHFFYTPITSFHLDSNILSSVLFLNTAHPHLSRVLRFWKCPREK